MTASSRDLWGLEPGEERHALCWYKRWDGAASLWDGQRPGEREKALRDRHVKARVICRRCPLLGACERALSSMERQGLRVEGVMAARYSDVHTSRGGDPTGRCQSTCQGCRAPLIPQGGFDARAKLPKNPKMHCGEGLCETCWPAMNRKARERR